MSASSPVTLRVQRLEPERDADLPLPRYMTPGAAGMDVVSAEDLRIPPGARALVPTGLAFEIPDGFEVQVRPRSGLAWRSGLTVLNAPGTIDSDYRGEVRVLVVNLGKEAVEVARGERVAQLVLAPVLRASVVTVDALGPSERGGGGFGSTGRG
jgi:dUTP pyrophosphatase